LNAEIPVNSIQKPDVEGSIWIRENTPKDSIFAVNRATYSAGDSNASHYFHYVMFAERQFYVEGTSMIYVLRDVDDKIVAQRQQLMKMLFENTNEADEKIITEGIDHVVQTKWITPEFEPNENLVLVHQTDSLNIYKLEK
jgi:hypothetical protein